MSDDVLINKAATVERCVARAREELDRDPTTFATDFTRQDAGTQAFEVWAWAQLGIHAKPVGLLNVAGYYDGLTTFLDHAAVEQFLKPQHRSVLIVEQEPGALLDSFAGYQPSGVRKWLGAGES